MKKEEEEKEKKETHFFVLSSNYPFMFVADPQITLEA